MCGNCVLGVFISSNFSLPVSQKLLLVKIFKTFNKEKFINFSSNKLQPRSGRRLTSSQLDQNGEKYQEKYDILANTKAENMPRRGSKRVGNFV